MFYRNFIKIFSAAGISQILPLATSPLIARLYSPSDFSELGVFTLIFSLLLVISTCRVHIGINIVKSEREAMYLWYATLLLQVIIIFIFFIVSSILPESLISVMTQGSNWFIKYLPLILISSGMHEALIAFSNRRKRFNLIAYNKIIFTSSLVISQIIFGIFLMDSTGLILSLILGKLIAVTHLIIFNKKLIYNFSFKHLRLFKNVIKRQKRFIFYDVPSSFIAISMQQSPNYLFKVTSNAKFAGNYFFVQKILQAPISLISNSILEVFKSEALEEFQKTNGFGRTYIKTFKLLLLISILPCVLGYFFLEPTIIYVYGEEWSTAGRIGKIMIPVLMLRLIANPLSFSIYLKERQKINLTLFIIVFISFVASFFIFQDPLNTVKAIAFILSLNYIIYIAYGFNLSKIPKQ